MKFAFFEVREDWEKEKILTNFPKEEVLIFEEALQDVHCDKLKFVEVLSIFIYSKCNEEMLSRFPNLKFVATRSTGFDHVDLEYCKNNKIIVCNVPHYGENTVAEFTFGLLITISRKIIHSVNRVKSGSFDSSGLRGFDLEGKTIGVIGFGNIGQKFAKMCKGFEMNVVVFDAFANKLKKQGKQIGVKFVDLDKLFEISDVVSLHIPLIRETKHILNREAFEKMKKGVIILNTSRGDLIDSNALLNALIRKTVSFAALDVLENENVIKEKIEFLDRDKRNVEDMETLIEDQMLISHRKVLVTPHNAFNTQDALERILNTSIENINGFLMKKCKANVVKLK